MFEPPGNGTLCPLCKRDFPSRKAYTDHHRNCHAPLYAICSAAAHLLTRREDHTLQCHRCGGSCGSTYVAIKRHYKSEHNLLVSVTSKPPRPDSTRRLQSPLSPSLSAMDFDAEGDDTLMPTDGHLPPTGEKADSPEPRVDEDNEWETRSLVSDASTEILVEEDDDVVVPSSFDFSGRVRTSDDEDSPMHDENPTDSSLQPYEKPSLGSARVYGSDKLQRDQPLLSFGYALNRDAKVAICIGCHRGVPVDMLNTHSKNHHAGRSRPSSAELDAIVDQLHNSGYRTSKTEKYHQPPGQKPVDGLEVLSGFCCPLPIDGGPRCSRAFQTQSTFVRHLGEHRGRKPDPSSCISDVQTLFSQGGLQKYFSVNPSLSNLDPSSSAAYAYAVKMLGGLPKANVPTPNHDRDRATIDWFTRWSELLSPYITDNTNISPLQSLVNFPDPKSDPKWLTKLRDHGTRWWKDAEAAHINCSYRASVMLRSHQKYSGSWKVLREPESARRYCGTAISLVSFCLRALRIPSDEIPTRFTNKQHEVLQNYKEYLAGSESSLSGDVEKFQSALYHVLLRDQPFDTSVAGRLSCPVQSYIALLSLRRAGQFVKPGLVTQPIARLMYLSRAVVLKTALADHSGPGGFMGTIEALCDRFLGMGDGKIMDELISLKQFADSLARREPGDPNILYNPNYTALSYRGRSLSFARLQSGLNELVGDAWKLILTLSGGRKIRFEVPRSMSEDVRSTVPGESFISRIKTDPPNLPLLHEMSQHSLPLLIPSGRSDDDATFEVSASAAEEFLHKVKPVIEAITFLLHFTSSGPLRLSEVVDDRFCNGSMPRNLLVSHGHVFLIRRNLKSSGILGHRSSVIHFPPEKVVDLLVYYLVVVRPVEIFLTGTLGWTEEHAAYSQFLYVVKGRKLTPQDLSKLVSQHTERYLNCRLTGSQARHTLISIQAVFLPPIVDPSVQKFRDSQAGHNSNTANWVYGQRMDHLPGDEADLFVLAYHWCKKLHTVLGLGNETTPVRPIPYIHAPPEPTWWKPTDYTPPHPPSPDEIMAQVHHAFDSALSSATDQLSILCEKVLRDSVFKAIAASTATAASEWQHPPACLGYPSTAPSTSDNLTAVSELKQSIPIPPATSDDETLLRALSLYTGLPEPTFTSSNQRLLLDAVLKGEPDNVIAVLPTGSGKSIAIFGPLLVESEGISIVITPYAALRRQLAEQARSFGIKFLVWSDRKAKGSPDRTSVQLVIMITDDIFSEEAQSLITNSAVVRVILDEAHSTFLSESYRPTMHSLVHLSQAPVQKVFLTATLVPHHQEILAKYVGVSLATALILRSPTACKNHQIQIAALPHLKTPFSVGTKLASLLLDVWDKEPTVRGIIFVRSLKKLENLSRSFPFPVCTFHGSMSDEEKEGQLTSWLSDHHPTKWIISTTALLHGVDYPRVDAVIFLEVPFGLYDFVQGAGRAGRSGQESLIAVLYNDFPTPPPEESEYGCRMEMERVIMSNRCRRISISKVMDGYELPCCKDLNFLLCDVCAGSSHPLIEKAIDESPLASARHVSAANTTLVTPPATPIQHHDRIQNPDLRPPPAPSSTALFNGVSAQAAAAARKNHAQAVRKLMERYGGCFSCRIQSDNHIPCHDKCGRSGVSGCSINPHRIFECTNFSYKNGWIDWKKRHFNWPKDVKRCYFCGLPGSISGPGHRNENGRYPGICQFSDTAIAAAWHTLHDQPLFEKLQRELGFNPGEGVDIQASFAVWLTDYCSNSKDIRLLSVFAWLSGQYYRYKD